MFESVIKGLIALCVIVALAVVVLWVLAQLGISLPPMLVTIFYIIVGLIAILILYRILAPHMGNLFP
jgi:hypothetical protein